MALNAQERAEFINAYTRVLITAWSSEEYARKLESAPSGALREAGLELPAGVEIVVVRTIPDGDYEPSLDRQIELFELGRTTGRYELHVPETPQVSMAELTEGDLEGVAAGDSIYCCCCPCCCCT
jgi:hypothetical protein